MNSGRLWAWLRDYGADRVIAGTKRVTASFAFRASLTASPPSEIARLRYRLPHRVTSPAYAPPHPLIAYISPGNRDRRGSSDHEILTVFERFEGV